jgi:hypothetical protein
MVLAAESATPDVRDFAEHLGAPVVLYSDGVQEGLRLARLSITQPAGSLDAIVLLANGDARRATDWNAAWDAARRLRREDGIAPLVCVIAGAADATLMKMVANAADAGNPAFDASRPAGLYLAARNDAEMRSAFVAVEAQIARAAQ